MRNINSTDTFEIVKQVIAENLEIDPDAIDLDFRFHHFLDMLASHRERHHGAEYFLYYLEAANIYVQLSEAFGIQFFAEFTDCACITIGDLVCLIQSKLDSLV
jgi:acyl carrier protein